MSAMERSKICMRILAAATWPMLLACQPREPTVDNGTTTSPSRSCNEENKNGPQWVYQNGNRIAVVFVHGIFGDTLNTWRNSTCVGLFDYLHESPKVGDKLDIYAFGYESSMLSPGSLKIGEAANKLNTYLESSGVTDYEQIVFVAHSMGGLITMRELISHPEIARKTPLLFFYATPHEGAQITTIAEHFVRNDAVRQMFPVDANDYLQQLNEDWVRVRQAAPHPTMVCAYEKKPTAGTTTIVPWSSSSRNCDTVAEAIGYADHLTIVKPQKHDAHAVIALVNAIEKYVIPTLDPSAWSTPDFRPEDDHWTYALKDINGRNSAVIENKGPVSQRYSVELIDDADMVMLPEQMPRNVPSGASDEVRLILVNEPKPEYRLKLRLGSSPERLVIARIENLDAAVEQRNARKEVAARRINAYLVSAENDAHFRSLAEPAQNEKLADIAAQAILHLSPDLPPGVRLLVTADTLSSLNLYDSAAAALTRMEQQSPDSVRTKGAQHVAAVVSAQSGKSDVLRSVEVPTLHVDAVARPSDLSSATDEQRASISQLAERLNTVPAVRAEALLLKGDVLQAEGDAEAAQRVYTQANEAKNTPLTEARARRAERLPQ